MRIISGEARGRSLKAPRGLQTRPTSDLLRGAVFSILDSMGVAPRAVLDLYAGTGALGIEALSRGADRADFVEKRRAACAAIHENLTRAGFGDRGRVLCLPVERALAHLSGPYDLVFVDPPYEDYAALQLLASPAFSGLLHEQTVAVYEHSRRDAAPEALGSLALLRTRSHGTSSVSFYGLTARRSEWQNER